MQQTPYLPANAILNPTTILEPTPIYTVVLLINSCSNRFMFDQCLYFNASALARLVEREWAAVYADLGLTPAQGYVLRVVLSAPGCLGSEIADRLGIARPTATRLIDSLSRKKLVERRQGTSDAREWGVYPTRSGKALDATINDASAQISRRLKAKIGSEVFESTIAGMRKIRKALR